MKEVTLTIDGQKYTVPEGTLLIDACEMNGIYVPRFCYHKHLTPSGNCRMCLVKIEKNPKPQPACMTKAMDGMIIYTNTEEIQEMRKAMLEYVLINHPLDCPICDKAGECMLQDQYMMFSGEKSRFNETKVAKEKLIDLSDKIVYDAERCIACSRCVRFSREVSGTNKLGLVERGDKTYVSLAPGDTFNDPYSLCVTDLCPVGALTTRHFRFRERVWNLHKTESVCDGCSRGCNVTVETMDNKIYRVTPRENDAVNHSWMCDYGRERYYSVDHNRLTGIKINGGAKTYKSFVEDIAQLLKENADTFAVVLSSHATNEELSLMRQLCDSLGMKSIFTKADREWDKAGGEIESDDILIKADKSPNLTGVKKIFPDAREISEMVISNYKNALVWGPNAPMEKLSGLKLFTISTIKDQVADRSDWLIAGKTPAEKHGSFTNFNGTVQSFRRAVKGEDNYDDLLFLVDLLKELQIQPIGRTVDEVRSSVNS